MTVPFEEVERLDDEGWSLLAVGPNKRPLLGSWKHLQEERATLAQLKQWHDELRPSAWAGVTGPISGRTTLDFDGEEGLATMRRLGLSPHRLTPGIGAHVDVEYVAGIPTLNGKSKRALGKALPGMDTRNEGGYIILVGRSHKGDYEWVGPRDPLPADAVPAEVAQALQQDAAVNDVVAGIQPGHDTGRTSTSLEVHGARIGDPGVDDAIVRLVRTALDEAPHDGRNDRGFWLACQLRDHDLPAEDAAQVMEIYVEAVPETNPRGQVEPYTRDEAMASLRQAYDRPARRAFLSVSGRPMIVVEPRQLSDLIADGTAALLEANEPPTLFRSRGQIVRFWPHDGRPRLQPLKTEHLRQELAEAATWVKPRGKDDVKDVVVPSHVAQAIYATGLPDLPALREIATAPTLRPDGTLLRAEGFDPATGLYLAPDPALEMPEIVPQPSREDAADAATLLTEDLLGEFSFDSQASRANAMALLLTVVIRDCVSGLVPLALIDAPAAGTGKTLLADVASRVATGRPAALTTPPDRNDEELRKRITSLLLGGVRFVVFDNVSGTVQSPVLAQAITAEIWQDRILQRSEVAAIEQTVTWAMTGNNIQLGGDLPRRCYAIRLDAQTMQPWTREFERPDLAGWATRNRGQLLAAVLTMARAWFHAGRPPAAESAVANWGGFRSWAVTIGGILEYAGVDGFLENQDRVTSARDHDVLAWAGLLEGWFSRYGATPVTSRDLLQTLDEMDDSVELPKSLAESLASASSGMARTARLTGKLRRIAGNRYREDGLRIEEAGVDGHDKTRRWVIRTE